MRDKISNLDVSVGLKSDNTSNKPDLKQEAESALIALGYKPQDATKMISGIDVDQITSSEQLIRSALKSMVAK